MCCYSPAVKVGWLFGYYGISTFPAVKIKPETSRWLSIRSLRKQHQRCEYNNKDKDNSLKTLNDKKIVML